MRNSRLQEFIRKVETSMDDAQRDMVSLNDELASKVYGGDPGNNGTCTNNGCSDSSNGTCTNNSCGNGNSDGACTNNAGCSTLGSNNVC